MLKEALRRLLWLGPTLLFVTVPVFWALAGVEQRTRVATARDPLPLLFNPSPVGARERARRAMERVGRGGPDHGAAETELETLGGAALPHVLSSLDTLSPKARGRVALALAPVARRMQIGSEDDFDSPESAVLFWTRYWEEHAIDFRAAAIEREVRRFAERPSALRLGEVTALDTFALGDLIAAMRPLRTGADVARVRHVCEAAAHVTENPWTIARDASVASAARVVERWETFWHEHRSDYVTLTGPRRVAATLTETRYGLWLDQLWRRGVTLVRDHRIPRRAWRKRVVTTTSLVTLAMVIGYPLAFVLGALGAASRRRRSGAFISSAVALIAASTAVGISAVFLGDPRRPLAALSMVLTAAALSSRHQRALHSRLAEQVHMRTARAFGASRLRIVWRTVRFTAPCSAARAVADVPTLLTASFVVERAFGLRGIGEGVVETLRSGNPTSLMSLALVLSFGLGVAQILADLLLQNFDPRIRTPNRVVPGGVS